MKIPLRVLIIEDSEDDSELVLLELRRGNYDPEYICVDTAEELQKALQSKKWDIILSDYSMPKFNGLAALKMAKNHDSEIPFIIISGTIGEEIAVMAMKSGAQDYIMKGNLHRLVPAVQRELKEYEIRKQRIDVVAELNENRAFLQAALDNSTAGIAIALAPDGYFRYVNEAGLLIRGGDPQSIVDGIGINEYVSSWQLYDFDGKPLDCDDVPLTRALKYGEKNTREFIVKREDGEERVVIANAAPVKNDAGSVTAAIVVFADITEYKKTDHKLKMNEILLNMMGQTAKIGGWEVDVKTLKTNWTEEIYTIHEVDSDFEHNVNNVFNFYPPASRTVIEAAVARALKFGEPFDLEVEFITAKGNHKWIHTIGKAHRENNKVVKIFGSSQDITERKLMEIERSIAQSELLVAKEKAETMNRLKSHFLANMSHELRTPLNGILGYADILTERLQDTELSEMAQGIYISGSRLSETLNFILDLSVVEADQIELFSKNILIEPIIKNSLTQFEANLDKKKLKLETNFPEQELTAFLDERLFGRIIYNLVDNAIKFTHQGVITIELKKEIINGAGWAVLYVKDTGIGIKKENYGLIFEDFRQVSEGISRQFEGTGLGLTITKKTVKLMGGEISVESTFGKGTIFTVKFPLVEDIQSLSKLNDVKDKAQETEKAGFRLPVVLYVEDDKINRDVMVMFLHKTCSVDTAESGEVALKMITAKKYDIILLDINLGDSIGGMGVVKSILAVPEYQNIPIIAVTSYSMGNERSELLNGGCTHFLAKPFRKQEIISLIESILKQ